MLTKGMQQTGGRNIRAYKKCSSSWNFSCWTLFSPIFHDLKLLHALFWLFTKTPLTLFKLKCFILMLAVCRLFLFSSMHVTWQTLCRFICHSIYRFYVHCDTFTHWTLFFAITAIAKQIEKCHNKSQVLISMFMFSVCQ